MTLNRVVQKFICLVSLCFLLASCNKKLDLKINKERIALSAIKGQKSKVDTLIIYNQGIGVKEFSIQLIGENADFFKLGTNTPKEIITNKTLKVPIQFLPDSTFVGLINTTLILSVDKDSVLSLPLRGLSTKGLEGKNEPPLSWVIQTLGYTVDLGWDNLANHTRTDLQGEEISESLFKKVDNGTVELIPLARYSPAFLLPYGYYTVENNVPVLEEVGVLSDSKLYTEHQTLFPEISKGGVAFTPSSKAFGIYTTSPSHNAYSEDKWNEKFHRKHAAHACRIYPIKNSDGVQIPNQFLVCFEEAFNGDYQDYVFLIKNVEVL